MPSKKNMLFLVAIPVLKDDTLADNKGKVDTNDTMASKEVHKSI